jgi:serine protease AprX
MHATRSLLFVATLVSALPSAFAAPQVARSSAAPPAVSVEREGRVTHIALASGALLRSTDQDVQSVRALHVPGSSAVAVVWSESDAHGGVTPWYAISLDGQTLARAQATSYSIGMDQATFDPLAEPPKLSNSPLTWDGEVFLVQFHTQVLAEYRAALEAAGARVYDHLVNHTLVARMTPAARAHVEALEVVRWVGPFLPELRLEPELLTALCGEGLEPKRWYNVTTFESGLEQKELVASRIAALDGQTRAIFPEGFRFEAELSAAALPAVLALSEVASIDRWSPVEVDLDIVRQFSGANALEAATGFTGQGVRGEVMDSGCQTTHPEFQHDGGVLLHGPNSTDIGHGTQVTGVVFGGGVNAQARGILPNGKIVFARYDDVFNGLKSRYVHTQELVDPLGPYTCVFQTNSWGNTQTPSYTSISQEMDDILFINNIVITQSQSNTGNTNSRPQAWAKNILSVGGIKHMNTLTEADDNWTFGGSTGPASDGRIKPDMAHFYDNTFAAAATNTYANFTGTSNATPCTVGLFGLFFQMWHNNVWNNGASGATVFDSRPAARLARAALINTGNQWTFSGTGHDLTRTHQGWGAADVAKLYNTRNKTFFVNETDVLNNLQTKTYLKNVNAGEPELKATLVYRDPKAVNFAGVHRINNLSLRVTSPSSTVYWGNVGLSANMWSTSGGSEDNVDVVENVFVQNPAAGSWTIEVIGSDINTDIVPATAGNNADFALWVTGVTDPCPSPTTYCTGKTTSIATVPAIGFTGSPSQAANNLVITMSNAVPNKTGLVFWGGFSAATPFQGGFLCVGGATTRGPATMISGAGTASTPITITGAMVGTTQFYQWWFRDPAAPFTTGLSNALQVKFCP